MGVLSVWPEMSLNLNDAAMAGNVEEVLIRINMGEDVNQKCYPRYSTPLHDAVCCGRQEVVQILVERGANVNELDYKDVTPLKLAIRYGQDDIADMLTAKGAKESVKHQRKCLLLVMLILHGLESFPGEN